MKQEAVFLVIWLSWRIERMPHTRILIFFIAHAMLPWFSHAADQVSLDEEPGTFIHFQERSRSENALYGYCYLGNAQFLVRRLDLETGSDITAGFTVWKSGKAISMEQKGTRVQSGARGVQVQGIEAMMGRKLGKMLEWGAILEPGNGSWPGRRVLKGTEDGVMDLKLSPWYPLFFIKEARFSGSEERHFEAVACGILDEENDPDFFGFSLPEEKNRKLPYKIEEAKLKTVSMNGIFLTLDENWRSGEEGRFLLPGETPRDAFLIISRFGEGNIDIGELFRSFILADEGGNFKDLRTLSIAYTGNDPVIEYDIIDRETGRATKSIAVIVRGRDGVTRALLFGAFESVFMKNEEYFKKAIFSYKEMP
jgi:hypothetical protein